MADCTLVSVANDEVVGFLAQRTVTLDIIVDRRALASEWDRLVERYESMTWMANAGVFHTCRAKVPVRAIQALVTGTADVLRILSTCHEALAAATYLVAPIADGEVPQVAARSAK